MSQAEELLNGMSEEIPVHTHPVPDTDTYFVIDPVTRKIENTNPKKHVIMQYDHNSERCTFELPRFIDGHDMLECTSVTVNVDNIEVVEFEGAEEAEPVEPRINSDAPDMTDLRIHPNDPEKVISSWLISRNSTQLAGILSFHIEYKCVDSNGNVVYEWSTDNYDEYEIRARKKNGEAAVAPHADLLEQWRTRIFGAGNSVMANIAAEGEAQVAAVKAESETQQEAVELKGAQTLDSIPEDYTEVDAMADEAVRSKGDAIVCEAAGESIVIQDSSNDYIRGLKIFGKSTQVTTTGAQLLDYINKAIVDNSHYAVDNTGVISQLTVDSRLSTQLPVSQRLAAGTYTARITEILSDDNILTHLQIFNITTGAEILKTAYTDHGSFTLTDDADIAFKVYNAEHTCRARVMLNSGSDILPWEPYTGGKLSPSPECPQEIVSVENPTVKVYRKNFLTLPYVSGWSRTHGGLTYTVREDGSIYVKGTVTAAESYFILSDFNFGEKSIASGQSNGEYVWTSCLYNVSKHYTMLYFGNGDVVDATYYPQVELGTVATAYEHPKPRQAISVKHSISGIPVTSGGNYTDENGQQWICDEIDLERGVYMQRLHIDTVSSERINSVDNAYVSTGGSIAYFVPAYQHMQNDDVLLVMSNWCTGIPCKERNTHTDEYRCYAPASDPNVITLRYPISAGEKTLEEAKVDFSGRSVMYVLREPIETPLTAEEITAFKALRTNYPNTTILNDAGAWMSVKYNADTKTYVENPKTLKLVDSSTGVVYELKIVNGSLTVNPV